MNDFLDLFVFQVIIIFIFLFIQHKFLVLDVIIVFEID